MAQLFTTLLIANRGEIACRIMRTARRLGIRTVAVYSDVDADAQHVLSADQAMHIGPAAAVDSYLNINAIIDAAQRSGSEAIHPGYGFLSENPQFVDACTAAGITFIGPASDAIRAMGLKDAAKVLMEKAGVPVVPGYHGNAQDLKTLAAAAHTVGYPVLIKARAGGGGKGMRRVDGPDEFSALLDSARREAAASFGDDHVLVEKFIRQPRHIEVQVFGDCHGNVVHLFERDCSLQRRHQKVIEESPAPGMTDEMRQAMTDAAVAAAKAINYTGAGTVEFIVDGSGPLHPDGFWFMEMNTRLQVEHPVTEAVTGTDLVEWQLRVSAGEVLPARQSHLHLQGHAVEARLYAEDTAAGFLPALGTLHRLRFAEHGRVDSGVVEGDVVSTHYDPMLAKLIAHGDTRGEAWRRLGHMLENTTVLGTVTNLPLLTMLCRHTTVLSGDMDTGLIEREVSTFMTPEADHHAAVALAAVVAGSTSPGSPGEPHALTAPSASIACVLGNWQLWGTAARTVNLLAGGTLLSVCIRRDADERWLVSWNDINVVLDVHRLKQAAGVYRVGINGRLITAEIVRTDGAMYVGCGSSVQRFELPSTSSGEHTALADSALFAPMPGRVTGVYCAAGDVVEAGAQLLVLEAMKMEHSLTAAVAGTVESVFVALQDQVEQGRELLRFAEPAPEH